MRKIIFTAPVIKILSLALLVFVFFFPLSARAEVKEGSFEVSPFAGYNFFEDAQNLKDSPVYGGRFGYNFTKHFGIEGAMEFINSRVRDTSRIGAKEGQFRSPANSVDLVFYHVDAVYHFLPDNKLTPFVAAGYGGTHYSSRISNQDMSTFDFGVGAKYWVADNFAFRLDLRDSLVTEVMEETYHNINATVGIVFAFGGKAMTAPPQVTEAELKAPEKVVILATEVSEPKIVILAFEDVHFDLDKSTLTKEAQTILKKAIRILKDNPDSKIRIAGYTSASGTYEYNQKLSERRAKAVEEYLITEGVVTPDRLSTIGYGETRPTAYEAAPKDLYSKAAKSNMKVLFEIIVK